MTPPNRSSSAGSYVPFAEQQRCSGRRVRRIVVLWMLAAALVPGIAAALSGPGAPIAAPGATAHDGAGDFDFEFGEWTVHLSRLVEPLTGSTEWVEYTGLSVVRPVWEGRANLGELEVHGPAGRIQGLSLRLYDPATGQWSIRWANSRNGELGPPMVGGFRDGVGLFYNQEWYGGRAVFVRFVFSEITADSFRLEQAFSADGGASWEANWVARFERVETR